MCIKKVERFVASDGTVHETERAAILRELQVMFGHEMTTKLVQNLDKVHSLLRTLSEPRNRERPEPVRPEPVRLATEEERLIVMEPIDTRTFEDEPVRDEGDMIAGAAEGDGINEALAPLCVDPGDLRVGQLVEFGVTDPHNGIIREINQKEENGLCVMISHRPDGGPVPDEWNAMLAFDEITKVLEQPEDRMDLVTAQDELDRLEAGMKDGDLSPLDHKRRILLNRRIQQLRSEANG